MVPWRPRPQPWTSSNFPFRPYDLSCPHCEAFSDFPKEFDPLAASRSRSRNGSERLISCWGIRSVFSDLLPQWRRVDLDEIFSAFKTSQELHMLDRSEQDAVFE